MLWTIPHSFGITHLNGSSTRQGLELVGWTLKVDAWDARENSRQGKQQQEEEVSSQRSSVKRGLAGPGSLQLGRPGSRPATCRLRAKGPLAWFTLVKPSCCKQHLAVGFSMEVQRKLKLDLQTQHLKGIQKISKDLWTQHL